MTNKKFIQLSFIIVIISLTFYKCADEKVLPSPTIYSNMPEGGYEIDINDTLIISPKITYDYNTQYEWILNNKTLSDRKDLTLMPDSVLGTTQLLFRVTSDIGSDTALFIIHRLNILRFEESELKLEEDTFLTDSANSHLFTSRNVSFPTYFERDSNNTWNGFTVSNRTTKNKLSQFCAYPGYGVDKSDNYLVYYHDTTSTNRITFLYNESYIIKSISVVNTYFTYTNITNGIDNLKLKKNESLDLVIKGFDTNGNYLGKIEYYLAQKDVDNRFVKNLTTWTKINLSELGYINQLEFEIKSYPDTALYIPGNIAIDNIVLSK